MQDDGKGNDVKGYKKKRRQQHTRTEEHSLTNECKRQRKRQRKTRDKKNKTDKIK